MPQKKKKPVARNAYYFYMLDFKKKKEAEGVKFPEGLKDVADAASPSWNGLDSSTKKYYENMAERAKVTGSRGIRYNTEGQTYEEADRLQREQDRKVKSMMDEITASVTCAGREGLKSRRFYFLHVNHFGAMENNHFIPCEVAVLAYTIEKGFQPENLYHEFIRNLNLPPGYLYKATAHSESTHKCPLPPSPLGSCDVVAIRERIWDLMERNGDVINRKPPPLYTTASCVAAGADFFNFMYNTHSGAYEGGSDSSLFRIYPLEKLFYIIKNYGLKPKGEHLIINGIEDRGFPEQSTADDIITNDMYDYCLGIACEFHREEAVDKYCSRSYVIRWSYIFSDYLCANLDIQMKPKVHAPQGTELKTITSQMQQLTMDGPREGPVGRGRPVVDQDTPAPRSRAVPTPCSPAQSGYGRGAGSAVASSSSGQSMRDIPAASRSNPQFQDVSGENDEDDEDEEDDDYEVVTPSKSYQESTPLRLPKTQVKSSVMLDKMPPPVTSTSSTDSQLATPAAGVLGRGRGELMKKCASMVKNS